MVGAAPSSHMSAEARPHAGKRQAGLPVSLAPARPYGRTVPTYVVESYLTRLRAEHLGMTAGLIGRAAKELSTAGSPVRYERWEFLPDDELCLHFFEAESAEAVAEALERAGLVCERIVQTVSSGG